MRKSFMSSLALATCSAAALMTPQIAFAQTADEPDRGAMKALGNGTTIPFPTHIGLFT